MNRRKLVKFVLGGVLATLVFASTFGFTYYAGFCHGANWLYEIQADADLAQSMGIVKRIDDHPEMFPKEFVHQWRFRLHSGILLVEALAQDSITDPEVAAKRAKRLAEARKLDAKYQREAETVQN